MKQSENSVHFTDVEMLCFLIRMNDIGKLMPYLSITNEELEETFVKYHELLESEEQKPINTQLDTEIAAEQIQQVVDNFAYFLNKRDILLKYRSILSALLKLEFEMQEPTEHEIKQLEQFILNGVSETADYPEFTEQEMEDIIFIMNGDPNNSKIYDTYVMNAFSYAWKSSTVTMKAKEAQKRKEQRKKHIIRIGNVALWYFLACLHYQDEAYLNIVGDVSALLLYQLIFYIKDHEEDPVKENEKIAYIFKWMMSSGILTGLYDNHLTTVSAFLLIVYYLSSKFYGKCAEIEKEKQKRR